VIWSFFCPPCMLEGAAQHAPSTAALELQPTCLNAAFSCRLDPSCPPAWDLTVSPLGDAQISEFLAQALASTKPVSSDTGE
jgi:hypothetical protein